MKDIPIIYEDEGILIVNKPCGIPVQGGEGITVTLLDILARQCGQPVYPVHRLDKDTAGLLVIAKNSKFASEYTRLFADGALRKTYQAVCFNQPPNNSGVIVASVGKKGSEKPSETRYRLLGSANGASLLELELGTGRMHQIRVHLASIGTPVIADDKYGDFTKNKAVYKEKRIKKLQLAAIHLEIPVAGMRTSFDISLPEHMGACLEALSISNSLS